MNYSKSIVCLVFIFKNKGAKLSEVKAFQPGKEGRNKDKMLNELNQKHINDIDFKYRIVELRLDEYIKRNKITTNLEAIQKYYTERYANKRYDSHGRWYKTYGVENLLKQEKDLFLVRIQEYKREELINDLIGKDE